MPNTNHATALPILLANTSFRAASISTTVISSLFRRNFFVCALPAAPCFRFPAQPIDCPPRRIKRAIFPKLVWGRKGAFIQKSGLRKESEYGRQVREVGRPRLPAGAKGPASHALYNLHLVAGKDQPARFLRFAGSSRFPFLPLILPKGFK